MSQQLVRRKSFSTESVVAFIVVLLSLLIGVVNPSFLTIGSFFNLVRSGMITAMFALPVLIVIVSGGIDVSFTAIAAVAMYITARLLAGYQGALAVPFLLGGLIGLALGLVNGLFISYFRLPTLIVTLGTAAMFQGFVLTFVGSNVIYNLPTSILSFSRSNLVVVRQGVALYGLHASVLLLIGAAFATWFILRKTMLGRGIYALGGNPVAAERMGFDVKAIQFFIYGFVGLLSGMTGILYSSFVGMARPTDLVGTELTVIAAVVLGGARITGGYGSVAGSLLGVLLVTLINSGLILVGISPFWQQAVLGLLILIGTGIPAYQARKFGGVDRITSI